MLIVATATCLTGLGQASQASPWFEVGDTYARFKLQQAADRRQLDATVTSWPLARSNARLADESAQLSWMDLRGPVGSSAAVDARSSSENRFIRGFDGGIRESELGVALSYVGDDLAFRLSPTYVGSPVDDENLRFDNSYIAATRLNLTLGAGYMDRWWGPGWQSSLILSSNARPIPAVWLDRRNTQATENWLMSWMGPWQFTGFAGQLEGDRYVPDAKLIGMRLNFRPLSGGLEVGLSRLIQWGGKGQPQTWDSFWDSFVGNDNYGKHGEKQDPGNQLAGIDLRYGIPFGEQTLGLYTQIIGEDEAGGLPARKVYQLGADWTSGLWNAEQQWFMEASDTLTEGFIGGKERPNYAYEHFNYKSGMRYLGRNTGPSIDADSRALSFGLHHFTGPQAKWSAVITYADLNRDGSNRFEKGRGQHIDYAVPTEARRVTVLDFSHTRSLVRGEVRLHLTLSSRSIQLADDDLPRAIAGFEWSFNLD